MLGVILLGNNLVNSAAATLVSIITIELFGEDKWALGAGTLFVTFAILVFAEITPKVIGANNADRLALEIDYCLLSTLRYSYRIDLYILEPMATGLPSSVIGQSRLVTPASCSRSARPIRASPTRN